MPAGGAVSGGPPPGMPAGGAVSGGPPPGMPAGGAVSGGPGGGMAGTSLPSMHARPYIARSMTMLHGFRGSVTGLIVLGLIAALMPFVTIAVFGPLIQVLGQAANPVGSHNPGILHGVWGRSAPLANHPPGGESGPFSWLEHPLRAHVLLIIWAGSLILAQVLSFLRAWLDAQVEWKLVTSIRQRVHDHLQTLSLDFFTGEQSGALMQRVLFEAMGVQRLLSECLVPLSIDVVVLVIALAYMLALSWQMTIVALVLSPLALITLRYIGKKPSRPKYA